MPPKRERPDVRANEELLPAEYVRIPLQRPSELLRTQIIPFFAISGLSGIAHRPPDDQTR